MNSRIYGTFQPLATLRLTCYYGAMTPPSRSINHGPERVGAI